MMLTVKSNLVENVLTIKIFSNSQSRQIFGVLLTYGKQIPTFGL